MNILFDYDGTLHDTTKIYSSGFRKAYDVLVEAGYAPERSLTDEHISEYLGLAPADAWKKELPDLPDDLISQSIDITGERMNEMIFSGQSRLYEGAIDVLDDLKVQGHTLLILSNCTIPYKEAHLSAFKLEKWFSKFYAAEEFNYIPKSEIFEYIRKDFPGEYIVSGDRKGDFDYASRFGAVSVGCTYGSGSPDELKDADYLIGDIREFTSVIQKITSK